MDPLTLPRLPQTLDQVRTLAELFAWRVAQTPDAAAYLQYDEATHQWRPLSWQATGERVARYAAALARLALP
ncbi:MAG: long-chain fatty acid--CoA ligase, partial [Rhodoferax sp.]